MTNDDKQLRRVLLVGQSAIAGRELGAILEARSIELEAIAEIECVRSRLDVESYPVILIDGTRVDARATIRQLARAEVPVRFVVLVGDATNQLVVRPDIDPLISALVEIPCDVEQLAHTIERVFQLQMARSEQGASLDDAAGSTQRLLLIEDDPEHADLLARYLRSYGPRYEIHHSSRLSQALVAIAEQTFDIWSCSVLEDRFVSIRYASRSIAAGDR